MTKRSQLLALVALSWCVVGSSAALTGREVIDIAQNKNGLSTWRDRTMETTMESYRCPTSTCLERTRDANITEQTDPRGEHRTFMEFTGPADVTGTLFLHLSPRGEKDQAFKMRNVRYNTNVSDDVFGVANVQKGR